MYELICECGHDVSAHNYDIGCEFYGCKCEMCFEVAMKAAQRAAAVNHLRHYGLLACKWRKAQCNKELTTIQRDFLYKCEMDMMNKIFVALSAYRAVGILKSRRERDA